MKTFTKACVFAQFPLLTKISIFFAFCIKDGKQDILFLRANAKSMQAENSAKKGPDQNENVDKENRCVLLCIRAFNASVLAEHDLLCGHERTEQRDAARWNRIPDAPCGA